MKKVFFTAFLLSLATLGFSQTAFTEQILNEIHQAFINNPAKTVVERTTSDFTMTGRKDVMDYAGFKTLNENSSLTEWPVSDVRIKQVGNVAIVIGITNHTAKFPNNRIVKFHQRFTETYEYKNGKWLFASAHYSDISDK